MLEKGQRNLSPRFGHSCQQRRTCQIKTRIKSYRKSYGSLGVIDRYVSRVGLQKRSLCTELRELCEVHVEKTEQIGELHPVNGAQAVQLADSGGFVVILNSSNPAVRDEKVIVTFAFGDGAAKVLYFPRR